jgi:hypothetical protein
VSDGVARPHGVCRLKSCTRKGGMGGPSLNLDLRPWYGHINISPSLQNLEAMVSPDYVACVSIRELGQHAVAKRACSDCLKPCVLKGRLRVAPRMWTNTAARMLSRNSTLLRVRLTRSCVCKACFCHMHVPASIGTSTFSSARPNGAALSQGRVP